VVSFEFKKKRKKEHEGAKTGHYIRKRAAHLEGRPLDKQEKSRSLAVLGITS
jgi:hypothetical protein